MSVDDMKDRIRHWRGDTVAASLNNEVKRSVADLQRRVNRLEAQSDGTSRDAAKVPTKTTTAARVGPAAKAKDSVATRPYLDDLLMSYEKSARDWLAVEEPWFTRSATAWLERHLVADDTVFEYGAGRSTVWWCKFTRSVVTLEASPYWAAYLNFYLAGERPELLAKLQTIHVAADWNPVAPDGMKRFWGHRLAMIDDPMIRELERKYVSVDPGPVSVVAFDGSIRSLTMARWALDGRGGRGADLIVVDNTEKGGMSRLGALIAQGYERLDFVAGPDDEIPEGQHGKHVTTVFVSPDRMERSDNSDALPFASDLTPYQMSPEPTEAEMSRRLQEYGRRLSEIGVDLGR